MDIGTGLALLGSAKVLEKVLGPTAEYIGEGVKNWTVKRVANVNSIFKKANERLSDRKSEELTAAVPPQLLMHILDFGSFTEDELIQKYLAGLLVSSRTGMNNDNRSSVLSLLVQNMSVYEIRLHYLFYYLFRRNNLGSNVNMGLIETRVQLQTYIPMKPIFKHVLLADKEREESAALIEHALHGLNRHNLIESGFFYGSKQHIESLGRRPVPDYGVVLQTSIVGIELFMWINDKGAKSHSANYLSRDVTIPELIEIATEDQCFTYP